MKEKVGKGKHSNRSNFLRKLTIDKKIKISENERKNEFDKYFVDIGPYLAKRIPDPSMPFEVFLKRVNSTFSSQFLSINEMIDASFSLKTNKSPGADEMNFNVIRHCFGELCGPLNYLLNSSLHIEVFLDLMKITIVSPLFKTGDTSDISSYCPICSLSWFSKIFELVVSVQLPIQILN